MFTTEGATCSASPEKSGRLTDGAGVAALPPMEERLRAEPEDEGRERDRLVGRRRPRRRALGGRRPGRRLRRLLGDVGARLSAVGEAPAVPHLEPTSLLLVIGHEKCPRPPERVSTPSRAAAGCAPRWG